MTSCYGLQLVNTVLKRKLPTMKHLPPMISGLFVLLLVSSCQSTSDRPLITPMVDGQIEEYIELGVQPIDLGDHVQLYLYQNDYYVWIAYAYPEGSYGILDMEMVTPKVQDTLNIHVSAQLGEWFIKEGAARPQNPESDLWWNHKGWYSNEVWPNGSDKSGDRVRPKFKNALAREVQLSKDRFGYGNWHFNLNLGSIRLPDGTSTRIRYPGENVFYTLDTSI